MDGLKDKFLWLLAGGLLLLKTGVLLWLLCCHPLGEQVLIFPDSLSYVYPAQTWLAHGQFWEAVSAAPMLFRTPGYPAFLAFVQLLFHNTTWAVVAVQNVLSVLLLLPVYLSARLLAGRTAARAAAGLCAVSGLYFSLAFAVLSETLCVFFLAWFVYSVLVYLRTAKTAPLAVAACLLAAAVYVRPAAYYGMFVFLGLLLGLRPKNSKPILVAFLLPLVLLVGAWHLRNAQAGGYAGFTTVNAYNLYFWNEDFVAQKLNISIPQAHSVLQNNLPKDFASRPPAEQTRWYQTRAKALLKNGAFKHKLTHAPYWAAKTLLGVNFVHTSRLLGGCAAQHKEGALHTLNPTSPLPAYTLCGSWDKILFTLLALQVLLLTALAAAGGWLLGRQNKSAAVFLGGYVLYFWAVGSVFFGAYARFRAPFEFVLCVLGAVAWEQGVRLHSQRKRVN